MAVVVEMPVRSASRVPHDLLDERIEAVMREKGGPPAGLMAQVNRPDEDGFLMIGVWRSESEMRDFHESTLLPQLAAVGLQVGGQTVWPVWTFARP